ncbi:MAG: ABC transporter permease subunit [Candidatus Cloacimonetes bacterium]|nr:ABC transporter permease subunit [Candidatus Cloacimonadota bacterium]
MSSFDNALPFLESDNFFGYLGEIDDFEKNNATENYKIIGKNHFKKGFGLIIHKDVIINIPDKNINIFYRYFFWISKVLQGNFGKTTGQKDFIRKILFESTHYTIKLIFFTLIFMIISAIIIAFIISYSDNFFSDFFSKSVELFSSIPEFLVGLFLLFLFSYKLKIYQEYTTFFYLDTMKISFSYFLTSIKYYSLPVITLSLASGNLSVLIKYIVEYLNEFKKNNSTTFLKANGLKNYYLYLLLPLKQIFSIILSFFAMKIPLILGSTVLIERVFNIHGIGYLAYNYFKKQDVGFILIIFSLTYLVSILLTNFAKITNYYLVPILKKQAIA